MKLSFRGLRRRTPASADDPILATLRRLARLEDDYNDLTKRNAEALHVVDNALREGRHNSDVLLDVRHTLTGGAR